MQQEKHIDNQIVTKLWLNSGHQHIRIVTANNHLLFVLNWGPDLSTKIVKYCELMTGYARRYCFIEEESLYLRISQRVLIKKIDLPCIEKEEHHWSSTQIYGG